MKIYKHVLTVTVLSPHATLEESFGSEWQLKDVDYAITNDDCIGSVDHNSTEEVPALNVEKELISLGNDGTFFDDLDDEDDKDESQRRDEKNGLYGEHEDPCN